LILASVVLAPSLDLWDVEPVKKHKPTKRENNDIYIPMKPMHKIKELYNKNGDTFIGKKCITALY
jgi:hypothetical protein